MKTILRFVRADFWQTIKFAVILWVLLIVGHVAQSEFRPAFSTLLAIIVFAPFLVLGVLAVRATGFAAFYFLNERDFGLAYSKLRGMHNEKSP